MAHVELKPGDDSTVIAVKIHGDAANAAGIAQVIVNRAAQVSSGVEWLYDDVARTLTATFNGTT